MENNLAVRDQPGELALPDLVNQVRKIQEIMGAIMRDGEHYGTIPGTKKKTLLKPGAEKLGFTFRLAPRFQVEIVNLMGEHREVRIKCELWHIPTNTLVAEGVGSCSTAETKYRYRHAEPEDTGQAVPGAYWDVRKQDPEKAARLLGGKGFVAKKTESNLWHIFRLTGEKVENPDLADVYNTVLKMAKKRAHVDAILTATAASDIFAQDLEDLAEIATPPAEASNSTDPPSNEPVVRAFISEPQRKRLFAIYKSAGHHTEAQVREWLFAKYGVSHSNEIPIERYEEICKRLGEPGTLMDEEQTPPWEDAPREPGEEQPEPPRASHDRGFLP